MEKQPRSSKQRKGDTGRTSSQGRKLASGGSVDKKERGNPEMDDDAKSVKTEMKIRAQKPGRA